MLGQFLFQMRAKKDCTTYDITTLNRWVNSVALYLDAHSRCMDRTQPITSFGQRTPPDKIVIIVLCVSAWNTLLYFTTNGTLSNSALSLTLTWITRSHTVSELGWPFIGPLGSDPSVGVLLRCYDGWWVMLCTEICPKVKSCKLFIAWILMSLWHLRVLSHYISWVTKLAKCVQNTP